MSWLLNTWDPFRDLERMQRDLDRLFGGRGVRTESPAVNVWTGDDDVVVTAEVPGVDPEGIQLSVVRDTVTLEGERKAPEWGEEATCDRLERTHGRFSRSIRLPYEVEAGEVKAEARHGILTVTLPRKAETKPKRINILSA